MTKASHKSRKFHLKYSKILTGTILAASLAVVSMPAAAQQAGGVNGYITSSGGAGIPGVTVEARSSILPKARITTSASNGRYQFPLLPPGEYTLTFKNPDGTVIERQTMVLLQQRIKVNVAFGQQVDEIIVIGKKMTVDTGQASLKSSIGSDVIQGVPVGQEYRDILKLIPGVQYSENTTRGPNAGGSGQDNIYQFDGVDVSLPMFGNLAAEPSSHDIDQVSIVRGGAKAIGFNRSGGLLVNTISKRGTNEFHGEVGYQIQTAGLTGDEKTGSGAVQSETDLTWITANIGGPILKDKLFFYGSYYRPTIDRQNRSNVYGEVGDFKSVRDEFFGKLTFTPTSDLLLDVSYRTSDRSGENQSVGGFSAASTGTSSNASQDIIIAEGSWIIDDTSSLSFKFTDFANKTASRPDTLFDFEIRQGDNIDINNLGSLGLLRVPTLDPGNVIQNGIAQPLIDQYGYLENGVRIGGGTVGGGTTINNQDFYRTNYEIGYNKTLIAGNTTHELHIGYQYQEIQEDLNRLSNGYGFITVENGSNTVTIPDPNNAGLTIDVPIFFQARMSQMSILGANGGSLVPDTITSKAKLQSFEVNNTIENGKWTVDIGAVISKDILYGQGLRENSANASGYELAPGNQYKMHETRWRNMIQPRFGVRYDWTDNDSVYANFARYNPPASSLARAASWDRNLRKTVDINFDANGNYLSTTDLRSSTGKLFQEGIKPRFVNEYLIGWERAVNDKLKVGIHARHRKAGNFWEDTPNAARLAGNAPTDIPNQLYIPNLDAMLADLNSSSSYVIAQLDTGYTKYYEAGIEAEYFGDNFYLNGSYTWSEFTGNFDQDNTTGGNNDANIFIGSSTIADGAGRYLWENREGTLRGDRPHQFKLFGYYELPWDGRVGLYSVFQSGQPWEAWNREVHRPYYTGSSDWGRFGEAAGSRRTDSHFQLDLNYTQNIEVYNGYSVELRADLFNVFNKQTGYNIQPMVNRAGFGEPRSYFNPRRIQLAVKARF